MTTTQREFKVGDKVKAFGCNGVVTAISTTDSYPILVQFDKDHSEVFTLDGKSLSYHLKPSLRHRKFKKSPIPHEVFMNHYNEGMCSFRTKEDADKTHPAILHRIGGRAWRYVLARGKNVNTN